MKLLTQAIKRKLPKIYATESIPLEEKPIICKFFNPIGSGNWYVIEGEEKEDDFIFFGLVDLHEQEFGYFESNKPRISRDGGSDNVFSIFQTQDSRP